MVSDLARIRECFRRGLIDQAAEEGVSLTLRREEELVAHSSLALAALGAMVGGAVQTDFALVFVGQMGGLRFHFVQPLAHFVQGPGELFFWLDGAPAEPLLVPGLTWWQRVSPLLRGMQPARFETARGEAQSLGEASRAALARSSRLARTGLAVWRLPWFAQLFSAGAGHAVLAMKALPGGPDRRERFPLKRVPFVEAAALAHAVQKDLPRGSTDRQDPIHPPDFTSLLE
ncbi:MAG: hypothetical protein Q8Q09_08520 [Deltaproteobacteria bacterium]|nr:hypothetical protein [Deltaproteobacteria bacterium]